MNIFNRVALSILLLIIGLAGLAVFLVAFEVVAPSWIAPSGWLRGGLQSLDLNSNSRTFGIIGLVTALVCLGLIALESLPLWKKERYVVVDTEGSSFELNPRAIEHIIEHEGARVRDVEAIHPVIKRNSRGLEVKATAVVKPNAEVAQTSQRLQTGIAQTVEQMTGLRVSHVDLKLKHSQEHPRVL